MAASLVNLNVVLVAMKTEPSLQIASAWLSLITLAAAAVYYIYKQKWVIPFVLSWASYAIKMELSKPKDSIVETFSAQSIDAIKSASGALALVVLVSTLLSMLYRRFYSKVDVESDAYSNLS